MKSEDTEALNSLMSTDSLDCCFELGADTSVKVCMSVQVVCSHQTGHLPAQLIEFHDNLSYHWVTRLWFLAQELIPYCYSLFLAFYRAMHYSAKRGLAIACRLSVRLSVTLVDHDHIGRKSLKLISRTISPTPSLFVAQTPSIYSQGNMGRWRIVRSSLW